LTADNEHRAGLRPAPQVQARLCGESAGSDTLTAMDLKAYIRDVPDFPTKGILYRDITPLLLAPAAVAFALDAMTNHVEARGVDAIVGIESRGFLFGMPIAARLGLPFVPVRKPGKLPAAVMSVEYALEYGQGQLDIHSDALAPGQRTIIVDDVLATGGTAVGARRLVEMLGARVDSALFLLELQALAGRAALSPLPVEALVAYG
jgi:adenine phosphoribosyltransferase